MRFTLLLAASVLSGAGAAASASAPDTPAAVTTPECAQVPERWSGARAFNSARDESGLAAAGFAMGEPVRLRLHPDGDVSYLTLPKGEGEASSFGGMARFDVAEAGTYRVGLDEPVWVDIVRAGEPAEAVIFGRGPECSGLRKVVGFKLAPGSYTIELSGNIERDIRVLVEPLPG